MFRKQGIPLLRQSKRILSHPSHAKVLNSPIWQERQVVKFRQLE